MTIIYPYIDIFINYRALNNIMTEYKDLEFKTQRRLILFIDSCFDTDEEKDKAMHILKRSLEIIEEEEPYEVNF